ncbi:carbohydrate ABC transporter permease [Nonomuraea rubra]|uniref:carbohydrate ABC transporter permease n=1 Tax=Nonomuraea rubra TaxID=46180 RepID=UPI0033DCDD33
MYEAARIDGAVPVREFCTVTLPGIRHELRVSLVMTLTPALRVFDLPLLATQGGPGATTTPSLMMYRDVFVNGQVGPGAAIAMLLTIVIFIGVGLVNRLVRPEQHDGFPPQPDPVVPGPAPVRGLRDLSLHLFMVLEPGDLIDTGTPAGGAMGLTPPVRLHDLRHGAETPAPASGMPAPYEPMRRAATSTGPPGTVGNRRTSPRPYAVSAFAIRSAS